MLIYIQYKFTITLSVRGWTPKVASAMPRLAMSLFGAFIQRDQAYIQKP